MKFFACVRKNDVSCTDVFSPLSQPFHASWLVAKTPKPLTDRYLDRLDRHVVLRILGLDMSRPPSRDQVLLADCLDRYLKNRFC
jgi:hypothetical protein